MKTTNVIRLFLVALVSAYSQVKVYCSEQDAMAQIHISQDVSVLLQDTKTLKTKMVSPGRYECRGIFESSGVVFPRGESTCILDVNTNILSVQASSDNVELVRLIIPNLADQYAALVDEDKYERTSLYALLSNPEKYNKKEIRTAGYLLKTDRGSFLFANREEADNSMFENAIVIDSNLTTSANTVNDYVRLKGQFLVYAPSGKVVLRGFLKKSLNEPLIPKTK